MSTIHRYSARCRAIRQPLPFTLVSSPRSRSRHPFHQGVDGRLIRKSANPHCRMGAGYNVLFPAIPFFVSLISAVKTYSWIKSINYFDDSLRGRIVNRLRASYGFYPFSTAVGGVAAVIGCTLSSFALYGLGLIPANAVSGAISGVSLGAFAAWAGRKFPSFFTNCSWRILIVGATTAGGLLGWGFWFV